MLLYMKKIAFDSGQFVSLDHVLRTLVITIFINCFIALFLYVLKFDHSFYTLLVFSQTIGISICSCIHIALFCVRPSHYFSLYPTVAMGLICGILLALSIIPFLSDVTLTSVVQWQTIFLGLSFGTVLSLFFIFKKQLQTTEIQLQEEQIKLLTSEKNALQMHLSLLQAQIEPHFLFNTLANIEGLLKQDAERAGAMLQNLTRYLRRSLSKSRKSHVTLREEIEMIRAYLEIFQIRMGNRLRYQIEIDPLLNEITVPPMILQPLVENSILHGLEPKAEGGEIIVMAHYQNDKMVLEVMDTGQGLGSANKQGVGMNNVKERLALFYGRNATLQISENSPQGLRIKMEVPCLLLLS
jgi:sensor histidine kinase YesM